VVNPADQLAAIHTEFGGSRDRLYELIGRADFKSAAAQCNELASIFARYCKVRAEMARRARVEMLANPRLPNSRRSAHLAAVAANGRTDQLDELLAREAIAALNKRDEVEDEE
jgi:hypothetical protein